MYCQCSLFFLLLYFSLQEIAFFLQFSGDPMQFKLSAKEKIEQFMGRYTGENKKSLTDLRLVLGLRHI
jgi:hypothetical protein